jgi:hypothetical protein
MEEPMLSKNAEEVVLSGGERFPAGAIGVERDYGKHSQQKSYERLRYAHA